jgi:hypothetical protein
MSERDVQPASQLASQPVAPAPLLTEAGLTWARVLLSPLAFLIGLAWTVWPLTLIGLLVWALR